MQIKTTTTHFVGQALGWRSAFLATALLLFCNSLPAQLSSLVLTPRWSIATSNRWDLINNNGERGIAINKLTSNILLASRTGTNHISILSGVDGSDLGTLESAEISGGTLALIHVRVAGDGVIYACNLSGGTSALKIYRWNSEQDGMVNPPLIAFGPAAPGAATSQRYGDSMDVRGAGTNTQIVMSGSGSTVFAVFTTLDGTNFTSTEFTHNLGAGELGKGITFEGGNGNNVIYGKKDGSPNLHKVAFDLSSGTATLLTNIVLPSTDNNVVGTKFSSSINGVDFVTGVLTANAATPHKFKAYTINNPSTPVVSADVPFPTPNFANGNVIGASDIGADMAAGLDVNNGITVFTITFVSNLPPTIVSQPADQTNVLAGGYVSFSVGASGTAPLMYQWKHNETNDVPGGTASTLTLTNLSLADSGSYNCAVTNAYGFAISAKATLIVVPSVLSSAMEPLWSKSVGDLFFLANDNTARGLAYNPATGHLIVASRTPSNGVHVVNAATGAYISSLDMSLVQNNLGTFPINLCGVSDEGAIYVANLDTSGANYLIYRWANEDPSTTASLAYGPADPAGAGRLGDTFAVRGAGPDTQLLASSRNGTQVVLFTTTDGQTFSPNVIDVATEPAGLAGLGVAFGAGSTFWTKSSGYQFRHVGFDLAAGTNGLLQTFAAGQNNSVALAVDPRNDLLLGIVPNTGTRPLPDNVELYNVHEVLNGTAGEPALIDQDFFKTENVNGNGTGVAAFDVDGGRVFALDTNNGLLALKVVARLQMRSAAGQVVLSWTGPSALQFSGAVSGPYSDFAGASSPFTNSPDGTKFFRLRR